MANWGGILAGGLAGGAAAAQGMAQGAIDDERRLSVAEQLSAMEEKRQQRIAEAAEVRRRSGRQADFEQDVTNAPRLRETAVADKAAVADATAAAERRATTAAGSDPEYLKGKKAIAEAGRAPERYSPETLAQAELTRMKIGDERKRRELLNQRAEIESGSMRGDQRAQAVKRIDQQLAQLERAVTGGKKTDEYDIERVVETEKPDPTTGETVRERRVETTNKRRPTAGAGKPAESSQQLQDAPRDVGARKVGTTYNTPRGPLVWRGNGWEPVR